MMDDAHIPTLQDYLADVRLVVLVAQEQLLLLGKDDVDEPGQVHLVLHNTCNVEPALKLIEVAVLHFQEAS